MSSGFWLMLAFCVICQANLWYVCWKLERARKGLKAVKDLIEESDGVAGLHLNGEVAPWDSLRSGGHYESWMRNFDEALKGWPSDGM
jgi:hypothetical protein